MGLVQFTKDANSGDAWGGSLKGAGKGAAIGSVVPGIGTIAGGVVGGIIGGVGGMLKHRAKRKAGESADAVAKYKRDEAQKLINKKNLNFAALLKALHREGWYGDTLDAEGRSTGGFVKDFGTYNPADQQIGLAPATFVPDGENFSEDAYAGMDALGGSITGPGTGDAAKSAAWAKVYQGLKPASTQAQSPYYYDPNDGGGR